MYSIKYRTCFQIGKTHSLLIQCLLHTRSLTNDGINHVEKQLQKQVLQEHLDVSYQRSAALFRKFNVLQSIHHKRLEDTVKMLKSMGIKSGDIYDYPMSLTLHSNTVEHNIKYLKEAGFNNISAAILLKFRTVVKKPVSLLKAHGVIPENTNVPKRLYSYLAPKPDHFPVLQQFSSDDSIVDIHNVILKNYLVWRLETTLEEINRMFKIYDKFKYKSFELVSQMIETLTEDLGFSNKKLLQHGYLFQNGPVFVKETIRKFPKLAGVDIKTVLFKYPKIIAAPPESIEAIDNYLKNFNISEESIRKCFNIYTLAPDTILYRLKELKTVPEFDALTKHPRIVSLMLCQNKAKLRLEHLQKLKVKCASINVLCASDSIFEKYAQEGNDRTRGTDLVSFICKELDMGEKFVRSELSLNPNWCHVPLIAVQNTLSFLDEQRIPKSDIAKLPVLLLYPRKQIMNGFQQIETNSSTYNIPLSSWERLNLCLYFIERQHHFSGDGIWENVSVEVNQIL